jgi:hypothetical protein
MTTALIPSFCITHIECLGQSQCTKTMPCACHVCMCVFYTRYRWHDGASLLVVEHIVCVLWKSTGSRTLLAYSTQSLQQLKSTAVKVYSRQSLQQPKSTAAEVYSCGSLQPPKSTAAKVYSTQTLQLLKSTATKVYSNQSLQHTYCELSQFLADSVTRFTN